MYKFFIIIYISDRNAEDIEVNKMVICHHSMQFLDKNVTNIGVCYSLSIFLSFNIRYYTQSDKSKRVTR